MSMNLTTFKKQAKLALDRVDNGEKLLITRVGKIYEIKRVN